LVVTLEIGDLDQRGVLPYRKLVVGETVRRDDFLASGVLAPLEGRDLRAGVDGVDALAGQGVPEADGSVRSTTSGSEEVLLEGGPSESLDRGGVVGEGELGGVLVDIVDVDNVVIATRSELRTVVRPLEATDLLGVVLERGDEVVLDADVVVVDRGIARAGGEHVLVPGQSSDAGRVTSESAEGLAGLSIPQLDTAIVGTDGDVTSFLGPLDRGDGVRSLSRHQLYDGTVRGVPEVGSVGQSNGKDVVRGPIQEVKVVIVSEAWGIEDSLGVGGNVSGDFLVSR